MMENSGLFVNNGGNSPIELIAKGFEILIHKP